ncbi:MAG: sulfocyanin-like copper-binding protein [Meiothermus sp.]|nr:sulfocyanin-like copper-binding protein [Meiothermus sp.]
MTRGFWLSSLSLLALAVAPVATAQTYVTNQAAQKTAVLTVVAASDNANGGLNFNGGVRGGKTFVIPLGWKVELRFRNNAMAPHSVMEINNGPIPSSLTPSLAAFPGAAGKNLTQGFGMNMGGGSTPDDTLRFTASKAGKYIIACGVPGYALAGQYIGLEISASTKEASFR